MSPHPRCAGKRLPPGAQRGTGGVLLGSDIRTYATSVTRSREQHAISTLVATTLPNGLLGQSRASIREPAPGAVRVSGGCVTRQQTAPPELYESRFRGYSLWI